MRCLTKVLCKRLLALAPLFLSAMVNAQLASISAQDWESISDIDIEISQATVTVDDILDPADHQCCVVAPPETVDINIVNGVMTIRAEDNSHWLNLEVGAFMLDTGEILFEAENTKTIASTENVRTLFTGQVFDSVIQIEAVIGANGALSGEAITYNLEIDTRNIIKSRVCGEQCGNVGAVMPKVVNGAMNSPESGTVLDTNVQFRLKATTLGNTTPIDSAFLSQDVSISTVIIPETEDIGKQVDIFFVLGIFPDVFTMRNQDGNFVPWKASLKTLVPYLLDVTLEEELEVTLYTGPLVRTGDHRIFVAYMVDGNVLYLTPTALRISVVGEAAP